MSDLISRSALIESFRKCYSGHMGMENSDSMLMFRSICKIINEQPAVKTDKNIVILSNDTIYEEFEEAYNHSSNDADGRQYWDFEEAYNHRSNDTNEHFYGDFG